MRLYLVSPKGGTSQGLDCLVVFGLQSCAQPDRYLTNDQGGGIVIFPLEGELVYLVRNHFNVSGHMHDVSRGDSIWSRDVRAPIKGSGVVEVLKEKEYDRATIGIVGLDAQYPGTLEGHVPYNTWRYILDNLPYASFREVSWDFNKLILMKSEEELQLVRRAAQIAEMACQAMLDTARPGRSENEIYVAAVSQLLLHGANTSMDSYTTPMILHSGPTNPSWGPPRWLKRGQRPRMIEKGDVITSEIFSTYSGLDAQAQMCIAIEPVDPVTKECARIARQVYEAGLKALVTGTTFGQVQEAMEQVLRQSGAFHLSPLIHSIDPQCFGGRPASIDMWESLPGIKNYKRLSTDTGRRQEVLDLVIQPNTVWKLEPNASIGKHKVNLGGVVIAAEKGAEELNVLPTEMRIISWDG